jgi:hypothetical protein
MHSPTPMSDYLINGMAAMIDERDRRKPVAAYLGASEEKSIASRAPCEHPDRKSKTHSA